MAFKRGGHSRPQFSISTSVFIRKGKYAKGPSFGLWTADSGPVARGSVKEEYLDDLIEFLRKAQKNEMGVSFALFKNKSKGEDDDGEYRSKRRDRDEDEDGDKEEKRSSRRGRKEEDEDEDKEERSSKRGKKGKKDDWDFDND